MWVVEVVDSMDVGVVVMGVVGVAGDGDCDVWWVVVVVV